MDMMTIILKMGRAEEAHRRFIRELIRAGLPVGFTLGETNKYCTRLLVADGTALRALGIPEISLSHAPDMFMDLSQPFDVVEIFTFKDHPEFGDITRIGDDPDKVIAFLVKLRDFVVTPEPEKS